MADSHGIKITDNLRNYYKSLEVTRTDVLVILSSQVIPRIHRRQRRWKLSKQFSCMAWRPGFAAIQQCVENASLAAINTLILSNVFLTGVLLYETLAWEVRMPTEIHGLRGSCLVIPCSYSYTSYPPTNPRRVVWYQWVSRGYPLVYDPWYPNSVIDKFKGKTDIYRPTNSDRDCSLLIKTVNPSHSKEKVYAWIDPDTIGWRTYKFYDVTSTIIVDTNPQQPIINISGGLKIGDNITVACYILHTCPYRKPNIILKGIEGSDQIDDVNIKNGRWKTTLTRTGVVKTERSDIECTVTHHGGRTTTATKSQSAKCVHSSITIEPKLTADIIEGVAKTFTCTVHHSCQMNPPILSWNYENMPVKQGKKQLTGFELATFSTITFLGTKKDDGKQLICTTNISGQIITASVNLHVQRECISRHYTRCVRFLCVFLLRDFCLQVLLQSLQNQ
ncbi:sialoadhesin-like [Misgurnus anguillicaudatus]|uniref:sialoadhesin-like n=1 Tax=Misgurnus anguillicaudatus TaxID=75329 RepID=UPI003CCF0642